MNIKRLNLNLLVTLHVLLQERNVTLASKALFITQPAVSLALKQLRIDFDDQLLIQNHKEKQMTLTHKAQQLKPQLESMIDSMQKIVNLNINVLHPEQLHGEYRIAIHSCISSLLLPQLYTLLKEKAPNIRLSLENITDINSISIKDQEKFDFFVGAFSNIPKIYHREMFLEESFVCLSGINELNQKSSLTKANLCQY
ncbi:LysR family transcriptional regulator [Francisella sp. 19X1-34]|uniref:LysR family transcriptional regulator n=1 Tax=Francisella sp. 19X1-34 TaxID=3087177 RepID=UPI002E3691E2|nr:LysR family transcriptional regulator [Francisella sp. 19X1-34]MED7788421.1 LysR family transcriptional regulator [Francisella sp. 19X1-34]